ncbi:hypothetical protein GGI12_005047 [Dipsacomyces acuminosporus]|nr:hypothetical protein GGI12_005047 [Dipsacomyces acuminosporus]
MPRSPGNNTLTPLLHKLSGKLGAQQAKNELRWMVEHVRTALSDHIHKEPQASAHRFARLWRGQPAPSEEQLEQDRLRLTSVQWAWLRQAVSDRTELHKPLQYILGDQPFGKTSLAVRPPVLIPRWETEEWMLKLAELIKTQASAQADQPALNNASGKWKQLNILDACTGSGCISLGLASELPQDTARIFGVDVSDEAIELAGQNLELNEMLLCNKVEFHKLDLLQSATSVEKLLGLSPTWDMIVSNPPYVTPAEYHGLDVDVRQWEDKRALVPLPANADPRQVKDEDLDPSGISFIVQLSKIAKELGLAAEANVRNSTLPRLAVEIGGSHQVEPVRQAMHDQGFNSTEVWRDMAGIDRVVLGYVKS